MTITPSRTSMRYLEVDGALILASTVPSVTGFDAIALARHCEDCKPKLFPLTIAVCFSASLQT